MSNPDFTPITGCADSHQYIQFQGKDCPLCALKDELRRLRSMMPSDVQRRDAEARG